MQNTRVNLSDDMKHTSHSIVGESFAEFIDDNKEDTYWITKATRLEQKKESLSIV